MYKDCYDDKHKAIRVMLKDQHVNKAQKGFYAEIICGDCEKESQVYDHYASLILTSHAQSTNGYKSITHSVHKEYSRWENIEFKKLQNFVYACLLRTQLFEQREGKELIIPKHFNAIRKLYNDDSLINDYSYPIITIKIPEDDKFRNIVILPFKKKVAGHHVIEFSSLGFCFWIFVSSHKKPDWVYNLRLNKNGGMYLIHMNYQETGTFKDSALHIGRLAKKSSIV